MRDQYRHDPKKETAFDVVRNLPYLLLLETVAVVVV
jgi:hypothetical protein